MKQTVSAPLLARSSSGASLDLDAPAAPMTPSKEENMHLVGGSSSNLGSLTDSFVVRWRKRVAVLIALLVFQSCSSFILASFEQLLQRHSVVVFFLTMVHMCSRAEAPTRHWPSID